MLRKLADGFSASVDSMPYSYSTTVSSDTGLIRLVQIKVIGTYADQPMTFDVSRRNDMKPFRLFLRFTNVNNTDPSVATFTYDDMSGVSSNPPTAFVYKEATSTWGIYVRKDSASDYPCITSYVPYFMRSRVTLTYTSTRVASIPSGATLAIPVQPLKPSCTMTRTSGTASATTIYLYRQGSLCVLTFKIVGGTSAVAAGSDAWVGTTDAPAPMANTSGCAYSGSSCLVARLDTSKNITVRVTGESFPSGTDTSRFSLVYFTEEA